MPFETEQEQRRRSLEAERTAETREADPERARAEISAAMERADVLQKEIKTSRKQMQNILLHIQQVTAAIAALRAQMQLAAASADPASVKQDKEKAAELQVKIAEYQKELVGMRDDLIREQTEMLRNEGFVGGGTELQEKARAMVDEMIGVNKRGFSLVEIIVTIGIFLLFAVGIYGGIQFTFKSVYASRLRILESGMLNEQVEIIRNMPFADVGILNGSPAGLLAREEVLTRNGIQFHVIRTIRNIDDPFDGTIGGVPNDTSPADYKLAEVEIRCLAPCVQQNAVRASTNVAPKYLEGSVGNGALFIEVYDAAAVAVPGAAVHVAATIATTTVDIIDTTDSSGRLALVDLPPGIGVYDITVSKVGYITDRTVTSSAAVPNPVKPWASVVAQNVTSISFWIDRVSDITLRTETAACAGIPGAGVTMLGTKLIGINPDVAIVSTTVNMDATGSYRFADLIWDAYALRAEQNDILGSIPNLPLSLSPGVSQQVDLILGPNSAHSLLVGVVDSISNQPVSNATVTVTSTGYSEAKVTGVGAIRQTDWSAGGGQINMIDEYKYWSDSGGADVTGSVGDLRLRMVGNQYVAGAELESSVYDLGVSANLVNLTWGALAQPPSAGSAPVRFQLATDSISAPAVWNYIGPDGTAASYYDQTTPVISSLHNGDRYLRYKVYLSTDDAFVTPTLSDISVSYTTSCTPPGQAYFGSLAMGAYYVQVSKAGFQTAAQTIDVAGDRMVIINLAAQ